MAGRHSKCRRTAPQRGTVEMVDTAGTAHLVSVTAAETGLARGRYLTLCAEEILPAAMVDKMVRYCRLCVPVPAPRSR